MPRDVPIDDRGGGAEEDRLHFERCWIAVMAGALGRDASIRSAARELPWRLELTQHRLLGQSPQLPDRRPFLVFAGVS